jgi:hypothetical protein
VLVALREPNREPTGCRLPVHGAADEAPGSRRRRVYWDESKGRWYGSVSLGFDSGGKRLRRKVSGKTKTEVKDKLRELHSDLDAGVQTSASYTVDQAVADWMREGRDGRSARTLRRDELILRPVLASIGGIPLHALRTHDVRRALSELATSRSSATVATLRPSGPRRRRLAPARGNRWRPAGVVRHFSARGAPVTGCHPPGTPFLSRRRSRARARFARHT